MNKKYILFVVIGLISIYFIFFNDKHSQHIGYKFNTKEIDKYHLIFTQQNCQNSLCETFKFEANLYTQVKEISGNDIWLILKLHDIKISANKSALIEKIQKIYQNPFLILISKNGAIKEFVFNGDEQNYGGLKQTIYYLDIPILNKPTYKLTQKDTLGKYEANYNIKQNGIKKQILQYTKLFNQDLIDKIKTISSTFKATVVKSHNWLDTLNGEIANELFYNNKLLVVSKNSISLKFEKVSNINIFKKAKNKNIKTIKKEYKNKKFNIYKEVLEERYKKEFQNVTIESMVNNLDDSLLSYSKLKDYLKIYPEKIKYLVKKFNKLDDSKQSKILGYLALISDIPQIQSGLINIYQDNFTSDANKIRDIIALGFTKKPTSKTIDFLLQELYNDKEEISNTALLAIGRISKYDNSLEEIIIQYYKNGNYSQKQLAIKAMKNGNLRPLNILYK